ncbi:uncharacterized protein C7orf57-like [Amphiura filiformis]|uniref:uncharacterized protein C7orf57-like n=1 Tax=Amphiura filiformis TaxID=82378 RepID=UPI003B220DB6
MAGNQGTQDWFYHAPAKKKEGEGPADYPAPSQIPLSSYVMVDERDDDTGMKRGWIRDTDSKYVKLAKMGGRKVMRRREPRSTPTEAKAYPRVEWFDHEEAEPSENENTGGRPIYLPEYMVHEEHNPEGYVDEHADTRQPLRRPPYSLQDKLTAFQRDGDSVTDKRVKLPEEQPFQRKPVGTKKEKQLKAAAKQQANQRKASSQQSQRYPPVDIPPPHDKANISKLLSMGYQMDWYNDREKYYVEQKKIQDKQPKWEVTKTEPKPSTEYRDYISKQELTRELKAKPKEKRISSAGRKSQERRGSQEENKTLFKISKFEKASPKVDTHWSEGYGKDKQELPIDTYQQQLHMDMS